jgi:hypothetical protein
VPKAEHRDDVQERRSNEIFIALQTDIAKSIEASRSVFDESETSGKPSAAK